jgi:hypothetical protein
MGPFELFQTVFSHVRRFSTFSQFLQILVDFFLFNRTFSQKGRRGTTILAERVGRGTLILTYDPLWLRRRGLGVNSCQAG